MIFDFRLPEPIRRRLASRLIPVAATRRPDFIVYRREAIAAGAVREVDQLRRWFLFKRNGVANAYLHQVVAPDEDRALHDHPWPSISVILTGGYLELLPAEPTEWPQNQSLRIVARPPGTVIVRSPTGPGGSHRLFSDPDVISALSDNAHDQCWTLFLTGPRLREWGFWCPGGRFVPWRLFTNPDNPGSIGPGCGD